jgi:uncharacterized protein (TIGR00303 family)
MNFLKTLHDPDNSLDRLFGSIGMYLAVDRLANNAAFALCLAGTASSDLPSLSAAGASPELCRNTPAADAEALTLGCTAEGKTIPVSPTGIVSPVVITRACLSVLNMQNYIFDCGAFKTPSIPTIKVNNISARCLSTGNAIDRELVEYLFSQGLAHGKELADKHSVVVIAECVPGGTTTALAVLTALGIDEDDLVSGSLPTPVSKLKKELVTTGLQRARIQAGDAYIDPIKTIACVGDPMQPFVAGMAIAASASRPVILAGGSMMLAVRGLINAFHGLKTNKYSRTFAPIVITTKWVGFDRYANTVRLSKLVGAHCIATCPNFELSRHAGLRAYEAGHVKEGVGAGAAMALAHLGAKLDSTQIVNLIDDFYDQLVHGVVKQTFTPHFRSKQEVLNTN